MKLLRRSLIAVGGIVVFIALSWLYTSLQVKHYSSKGVYETAEQGMRALVDKHYSADHETKIVYAGTNSFDGSKPHIWYVIAEVHASSHADGSDLYKNGCEDPGSFFLQTKDGWIFVPEGAFPGFMGFWMGVFDMAGPGQSEPSVNWAPDQNPQFCLD